MSFNPKRYEVPADREGWQWWPLNATLVEAVFNKYLLTHYYFFLRVFAHSITMKLQFKERWHLNAITSYLYSMILTFAKRQVCMSFTFYKNYHVCFCSSQPARIMSLWLRQTMGHWTRLERQSGNRQVTYSMAFYNVVLYRTRHEIYIK